MSLLAASFASAVWWHIATSYHVLDLKIACEALSEGQHLAPIVANGAANMLNIPVIPDAPDAYCGMRYDDSVHCNYSNGKFEFGLILKIICSSNRCVDTTTCSMQYCAFRGLLSLKYSYNCITAKCRCYRGGYEITQAKSSIRHAVNHAVNTLEGRFAKSRQIALVTAKERVRTKRAY